jgi:hypothetical protein
MIASVWVWFFSRLIIWVSEYQMSLLMTCISTTMVRVIAVTETPSYSLAEESFMPTISRY